MRENRTNVTVSDRELARQRNHGLLGDEEKMLLARQAQDKNNPAEAQRARDRLFAHHQRMVFNLARGSSRRPEIFSELMQEGNIGLIAALENYNPDEHSASFSTYARWWVQAYIWRHAYYQQSLIRLRTRKNASRVNSAVRRAERQQGDLNIAARSKVAAELEIPTKEFEKIYQQLRFLGVSTAAPLDADGKGTLEDTLVDRGQSPEEKVVLSLTAQQIREVAVNLHLSDQERIIFSDRLCAVDPIPLEKLAQLDIFKNIELDPTKIKPAAIAKIRQEGPSREFIRLMEVKLIKKIRLALEGLAAANKDK